MERLYLLVVTWPKTLLVLLFLLTCVFGLYAKDLRLDSSVESLLSQDNPDSRYYDEVRQLFGSDEVGVVGLLADDIYTADVLHKIMRLTKRWRKSGVSRRCSVWPMRLTLLPMWSSRRF